MRASDTAFTTPPNAQHSSRQLWRSRWFELLARSRDRRAESAATSCNQLQSAAISCNQLQSAAISSSCCGGYGIDALSCSLNVRGPKSQWHTCGPVRLTRRERHG